ncbi:hypothetical protein Pint_06610 [Pistacia integerrima]|uniref:Uncharacterized protein n=1 Tax=Pistacia integerrima TaxID=434235 RepID=A0ACC0Z1H6_9ROSI|nr:hypothetical protein Pint_06610 [Pistacia integerrima]
MGNGLPLFKPATSDESGSLGPHGVSVATVGVSALAHDLFNFEINSQSLAGNLLFRKGLVSMLNRPGRLRPNWYRKILEEWKQAKPPPKTAEEATRLVVETLKTHQKPDVEGLLAFYGLPLPVKFEMQSLPVEDATAVADGDTITVYVRTDSQREESCVPRDVQVAAERRSQARAERNYAEADARHQKIVHAGYRVINLPNNEEVLAQKYRIRLRGIDAPESAMPYGEESKQELLKLVHGKSLTIRVYEEDRYGRSVGDVYSNGIFVQEEMLKKGCAWHYNAYDERPEFSRWEEEARAKRVGLWAASNPEKPWEWRKDRREGR